MGMTFGIRALLCLLINTFECRKWVCKTGSKGWKETRQFTGYIFCLCLWYGRRFAVPEIGISKVCAHFFGNLSSVFLEQRSCDRPAPRSACATLIKAYVSIIPGSSSSPAIKRQTLLFHFSALSQKLIMGCEVPTCIFMHLTNPNWLEHLAGTDSLISYQASDSWERFSR